MGNEKIYMIPVNDAFSINCECAFCYLENNFEKQCIEIVLGESVMEVDARIETNKKGFCRRHFHMLLEQKNKLPYGLILETHLNEIKKHLENLIYSNFSESSLQQKEGFIKKLFGNQNLNKNKLTDIIQYLENLSSQCVICERIQSRMKNYFEVFFFMWKNQKEFQQKVLSSKGFCLHHFNELLKYSIDHLSGKEFNNFVEKICKIELDNLSRIYTNVCDFNKQFDYRNANNTVTEEIRNSLLNATEKLGKYK
uniref:ABC transporter substrate-binding protein n=1 Tax=Caldicellulosiruptor owensensis TaxID=55205 RepID=A0A7C5V6F4_9FIRM